VISQRHRGRGKVSRKLFGLRRGRVVRLLLHRRTLEHCGSNLYRCRGHGDHPALIVNELPSEKAHVLTAAYDAPSPYQTPRAGWTEELYVQVRRRGEVAGVKPSNQSGSQRVIEHGGQETALDDPGGIHEGTRGCESNLDRSLLGVDGEELPTERDRRWRERCPALHRIPEGALALHVR
jgi:hypothetical protein